MPSSTRLLRAIKYLVLLLLVAIGLTALPAAAAPTCGEAPPEKSTAQQIDDAFGQYVVGTIASVFFYDVIAWDNTLPLGKLPETKDLSTLSAEDYAAAIAADIEKSDAELVGFTPKGSLYQYRCRQPARLRDVRPVIADDATVKRGILTLSLSERDGRLFGAWEQVDVDPASLGLSADAEGSGDTQPGTVEMDTTDSQMIALVELDAVAPFPVRVNVTEGHILAGEVEIPWSDLSVQAGDQVVLDGVVWEVAASNGRRLGLRSLDVQTDGSLVANPENIAIPVILIWLVAGAVFFTFRYAFINFRAFVHAIKVTAGQYDHEDDPGEVSHFQALSSALSATVGLGNIAGVAVAVAVGGPGAVVWMVIAAFFGMTTKFTEVTLGQMYRVVKADGSVSGGPMHYLSKGLSEMRMGGLGWALAALFSLMCIGGSFGGGNMFQGNQAFQAIADVAPLLKPAASGSVEVALVDGVTEAITIPAETVVEVPGGAVFLTQDEVTLTPGQTTSSMVNVAAAKGGYEGNVAEAAITQFGGKDIANLDEAVTVRNPTATAGGGSYGLFFGIVLTVIVGLVIIGGIKRIGATAGIIVPAMGVVYVLAGLWIIGSITIQDSSQLVGAVSTLFSGAFTPEAGLGGLIGAMVQGFRRASFSNEAGVGSASIAHSAAATTEPVREGIVALLEPFIDTVIVCSITGLVVVVTGAYEIPGVDGITMTARAFEIGGLPGSNYILAFAVVLFAFSTMISWSYYGERAATWLFGDWASLPYKVLFLICVILGPILTLDNVIGFSDLMILGMAFPNILGLYLLSNKVGSALKAYMSKLSSGAFD